MMRTGFGFALCLMLLFVGCGRPGRTTEPSLGAMPVSTPTVAVGGLHLPTSAPGPTGAPITAAGSGALSPFPEPTAIARTLTATETRTPSPQPTARPIATLTPEVKASPAPPIVPFNPKVEVVASNLEIPWALAFAPDGRLFFTERPGRVRVIIDGRLQPQPVGELAVAATGEGGLMGLALDPAFAENGYLYVMYTYRRGTELLNRISRFTLRENRMDNEIVLLDGIPGASNHDGGRLKFGPDGKLYATSGDAQRSNLSQDVRSLAGKILRLNPDGSVPADNPFPGSPVYSYGHRNPEGLAWQLVSGQLFSTEHGPSGEMGLCCRDEVNLITPGSNYGWPLVTGAPGDPRFVDPTIYSGLDTWAPAGAAFYEGDALTPWKGSLLFGTLRGQHLHRLVLGGPNMAQVIAEERLFEGQYGRIREVVAGPDGYVYFTTSNRDGRGTPATGDDRILRIVPGR